MYTFRVALLVSFFFSAVYCHAQDAVSVSGIPAEKLSVGVGAGYDYGGFGANATFYPQRSIGIFGGLGYAVAGVGWNAGIKLRVLANQQPTVLTPFIMGMYGYFAEASPKGYPVYNKLFYGPTVGAGLDFHPNNSKFGYLSFAVLLPFRTPDPQRYINNLSTFNGIAYDHKLSAVGFSLGYKFNLFIKGL